MALARAFAERGERHLSRDDDESAWRDLLQAEELAPPGKEADRLRRELVGLGMNAIRGMLLAGEVARADQARARLRQRGARSPELLILEEAITGWSRALELADQGEASLALDLAERSRRLLGANEQLESFVASLRQRRAALPEALAELYEAAESEKWGAVLEKAEQVLALAPQHAEARALRTRAWRALEPVTLPHPGVGAAAGPDPSSARFLLWIDGVGGYLVCLSSRLTFGQARLDGRVDIPVVADVSRIHASLSRDEEGYLLEAMRPIQVNGSPTTRALLRSGDQVTLGSSCQMRLRLPVPGSLTATLELVSGHRLPVGVAMVALMADTLILGGPSPHIPVPGLSSPVVLFKAREGLGMRFDASFTVNGQPGQGRTTLPAIAQVSADQVSFAIEPAT